MERIPQKSPRRHKPEPKPSLGRDGPAPSVNRGKAGCACGGGCPRCTAKKASRLKVGPANDSYEREAQTVARGITGEARIGDERGAEKVRRSEYLGNKGESGFDPGADWESHFQKMRSSGVALNTKDRALFEPQLGQDLSQVRVHHGTDAHKAARDIGARAFTLGSHIVFGKGFYQPHHHQGRSLLAHELTHVAQQNPASKLIQRDPDPSLEGLSFLQDLGGQDPIHGPLINQFRRDHGLPPGGVDPFGNQVGPTDFEIKSFMLQRPICPSVTNIEGMKEDFKNPVFKTAYTEANCLTQASRSLPPGCRFSGNQQRMLKDAQELAAKRMDNAASRLKAPDARTQKMAQNLFNGDPPPMNQLLAVAKKAGNFLRGSTVRYEGRTCGDESCNGGAVAYVTGPGALPIYICPSAFSYPRRLHRTIIHESVHWAGIDADPSTPEGYCPAFDCVTPCLGQDAADAWMYFLDCLGR